MEKTGCKFRWGISADAEKFDPKIPFYEIPLGTSTPKTASCSITSPIWYPKTQDPAELWERDSVLLETCKESDAEACVIQVPPSALRSQMIGKRIHGLISHFEKKEKIPIYFDFGKFGPLEAENPVDLSYCVFDPLWERQQNTHWRSRAALSSYWKIHGWHTERWVRMYPEKDLQEVLNLSDRMKPQFLIFGHSQRRLQYLQLVDSGPHRTIL